jgi:hypothetical protein
MRVCMCMHGTQGVEATAAAWGAQPGLGVVVAVSRWLDENAEFLQV